MQPGTTRMSYALGMDADDNNTTIDELKLPSRWLYVAGGGFTVVYLGAFAWYCWQNWADLRTLQPNTLGDFLAGSFSPLAFAWLVLGFIQQGIELRQNSRALLLQHKELRQAAAHAGAMVELHKEELNQSRAREEAARAELEARRAADARVEEKKREAALRRKMQPDFYFTLSLRDTDHNGSVQALENRGHDCTQVRLVFGEFANIQLVGPEVFEHFEKDLQHDVQFTWGINGPAVFPLTITFSDGQGIRGTQHFKAALANGKLDVRRDYSRDQ